MSAAKNNCHVSLPSLVSKIFEKLVNNRIVLLDQLQIFSQLYPIELLGILTELELLELWRVIHPRLLTAFDMLIFFTNVSLTEFQVRYLALFLFFSVKDDFEWFWMESLHKNIQLIWRSSKLHSCSYTFSIIH